MIFIFFDDVDGDDDDEDDDDDDNEYDDQLPRKAPTYHHLITTLASP